MTTKAIRAVQYNGNLGHVEKEIARPIGDVMARAINISESDEGELRIGRAFHDDIVVERGQWITYDLEVYDNPKLKEVE